MKFWKWKEIYCGNIVYYSTTVATTMYGAMVPKINTVVLNILFATVMQMNSAKQQLNSDGTE